MIVGHDFVYCGPEPWDTMWRNRHQLLSRLARANRVVYVEPYIYTDAWWDRWRRGRWRPADLTAPALRAIAPNLWSYRWPLYAPAGGPRPLRELTRRVRGRHLRQTLTGLGIARPIFWLSHPIYADARNDVPARLRVYHIVDDYLGYQMVDDTRRTVWAAREQALIAWADLVVAVSAELMESKGRGDPRFRLLPNAVDTGAYWSRDPRPAPALAGLPRPILGYVGLIGRRLDLELLDELAAAHPEWTFALIGEAAAGCEAELDRLTTRPNVHLLGTIPASEVADHIRQFDLGLVPYRLTRETHHASPLKVYEYLAAGIPVVSADVPGSRLFAETVTLASAAAGWAAAISRELAENTPATAARRRAAVAPHTWDARVETLSGYLAEALA